MVSGRRHGPAASGPARWTSARSGRSPGAGRRPDRPALIRASKRNRPLQRTHGFGVRPAAWSRTKASTTCSRNGLAQVERQVGHAQRVAGAARSPHRLGRAAGALGVRRLGVDPQPQRHADRLEPRLDRLQQGHRAVHATAHGDGHPALLRWQPPSLQSAGDGGVQRVDGQQRRTPGRRNGPQLRIDLGRADAGRVEQLTALGQRADQRGGRPWHADRRASGGGPERSGRR